MSPFAIALTIAAGVAVFAALRRGAAPLPLLLLALPLLPFVPLHLPAPLLIWSDRVAILVWVAVAASMAAPIVRLPRGITRPVVLAGVLAFCIGGVSYWQVRSQVPGGDEPHYLIITQSLLRDGDLRIENNHRQRDYESYFAGVLEPDFRKRGKDGEIYSIHAPGVSALIAPVFALGGYPATVLFLLIVSALGSALAWHLAREVSGRDDAAWFGWAAVTFSTTWIFHSFAVYPDGPGAVLVLTGVWALHRAEREAGTESPSIIPWLWHGAALAALPWMHTRFAVLAAGLGALTLLRLPPVTNAAAKAFAFLALPAVSGLGWLSYFIALYGTPNPAAPYGQENSGFEYVPDGLAGLLFDQGFGLLMYAPALLAGFVGIGVMLSRRQWRRRALEHLFVLVPYLIVVTHFAMWWGGRSAPARFFVPVLLWMAIPAAVTWTSLARRSSRVLCIGALIFTAFASAVLVFAQGGRLAFNEREVYAVWLPWLNRSLDLGTALPMWWRNEEVPLFRGILVWICAGAAAWLALRGMERVTALADRVRFAVTATAVFAVAGSAAAAVQWRTQDLNGRSPTPGQLDLLRTLSREPRAIALSLSPPSRLSRTSISPLLRIEPARATGLGGAGRNDRPLFNVPSIPAGSYRLTPSLRAPSGWLMIGIGQDQFAVQTVAISEAGGSMTVQFPVDVRALIVRGDEDARFNMRGLLIEPVHVLAPSEQVSDGFARHAVRYGASTMYFMDERSFPEPEAFWVGGSRSSDLVLQPDAPRAVETLLLRNGAADNVVLVSSGAWREELRLGPGEERRLQIPLDLAKGATLLRFSCSSGFRPSAIDPKSRDHRFLGVWVKVGG